MIYVFPCPFHIFGENAFPVLFAKIQKRCRPNIVKTPTARTRNLVIKKSNFPNQEIEWSLRDGRVRHEGLRLQVGQLELTSSGSVGLDQSLDVVLGFKIPDSWLTGRPLLASLRGQTLFVPLEGSLENMDLKTGVLVRVNEQLLRQTTSELFRQGLKRLFDN